MHRQDPALWKFMFINKKQLEGKFVSLEPLSLEHIDELKIAVQDGESWKLWYANVPTPDSMAAYVQQAIVNAQTGALVYAVRHKASGKIVGTTRYYKIDAENHRAMIGYTWYSDSVRRSPVNTECKLLLLENLFEASSAIAAEFRTHIANLASRRAIERLGAKLDGILRNHQKLKNGTIRDTAVYSIIASEWPELKANLVARLAEKE